MQIRFQPYSPPCISRFKNESEKRGFEFFQNTSAVALGPGLGSPAWVEYALQNSEHSLVLRHAAIALGAIHEHELHDSSSQRTSHSRDHLKFAYRQYGEAIRQFRSDLSLQLSDTPERAMLACILFTIFDFVQGDDQAAATHLRGGLMILRKVAASSGLLGRTVMFRGPADQDNQQQVGPVPQRSHCYGMSSSESMQRKLIKIFAYLDFWSTMWSDGEILFPEFTLIEGLPIEPVFNNTDDLHFHVVSFSSLEHRIHEFLRAAKTTSYDEYDEALSTSFFGTKQDLLGQLYDWKRKLATHCVAEYDDLDHNQRVRVRIAELNHQKIQVMLQACQVNGSFDYRAFDPTFRHIISMSKSMISSTVLPTARTQVFSFAPKLIHPLYITAMRCYRVDICEEAIELLESSSWVEGAWNSTNMARIARRKLEGRLAFGMDQAQ